jgi:all-trans-retinol dehydrogenase (NAD+)
MTQWANATALVTGAARGMGRRLALEAVARGADVVAWDVDELGLAELRDLADEQRPGAVRTAVVDVTDEEAVRVAGEAALARGPVDILVNNAGVVSGADLLDLTPAQVRRTFGVNVLSLFWTSRVFLPPMVERNAGHVVTIASAAGLTGARRLVDYSASKHAAVGFDESLRNELRTVAPGVRTTVVCPFYVNTGMFDGVSTRIPWLLPILEPDDVVARVVRAIERDEQRVFLPGRTRLMYLLHLLPTGLGDAVLDLVGANRGMDEFVGHGRGPAEVRAGAG